MLIVIINERYKLYQLTRKDMEIKSDDYANFEKNNLKSLDKENSKVALETTVPFQDL